MLVRSAAVTVALGIVATLAVVALAPRVAPAAAAQPSGYNASSANPTLTTGAGLDVALVLDTSGSMGVAGIAQLKAAVDDLLMALLDTGTVVSVTSFSTVSPGQGGVNLPPTALTEANLATVRAGYVNLRPGGSTGWQDGLLKSQQQFRRFDGGRPDLLLFLTDGNPNIVDLPGGGTVSVAEGSPEAVNPAVAVANQMRDAGVHMFGVAMGAADIQVPVITGGVEYDGANVADAGFARIDSPAGLQAQLRRLVADVAAPSLTLTSWAQTQTLEGFAPAAGWDVATEVTIPAGRGSWVSPARGDAIARNTPSVRHRATSEGGRATFQWRPDGGVSSSVVVSGQPQAGYRYLPTLQCQARQVLTGAVRSVTVDLDRDGRWTLGAISPTEIVVCAAHSTVRPRLTLVADVDNGVTGGTSGRADFVLTAAGETSVSGASNDPAVTRSAMDPGTYDLSVSGPPGYAAGDWVCTGAPASSARAVTLGDGDDVRCVVSMTAQQSRLTLATSVTNDDLGSAQPTQWTLAASGPATITGSTGSPAVTSAAVPTGTYTLSQFGGPPGYGAGAWSCTGGSLDGTSLYLPLGDSLVCTVTLDDEPATATPPGPAPTPASSPASAPAGTAAPAAALGSTQSPAAVPEAIPSRTPTPARTSGPTHTATLATATPPADLVASAPGPPPEPAAASAPAPPIASSTPGPAAVYDPASQVTLHLDLAYGEAPVGRGVDATAESLQPASSIAATLYSEPTVLLRDVAGSDGSFTATSTLPPGLAPGIHTVVLTATSVTGRHVSVAGGFALDDEQRVVAIAQPRALVDPQPGDPRVVRALRHLTPPYDAKADPMGTAAVGTAVAAALGLLGAGVAARGRRKGSVGRITAKRLDGVQQAEPGHGDLGWTWRWPFTRRTDAFARWLPTVCATRSNLVTRLSLEGAWARAVLGSGGYLLWVAGAGLAIACVSRQQGLVTAPPMPILLALVALGLLDASAGAVAWLVLCLTTLVSGGIGEPDDARTLLGIGSLLVLPALAAHIMRPLRRPDWQLQRSLRLERLFDYLIPPVLVAFLAGGIAKALNGLSGLELVTAAQATAVSWVAGLAIVARYAAEDLAALRYPVRTHELTAQALPGPSRSRGMVGLGMRFALFVFVAEPFFGLTWATVLAGLLCTLPGLLALWQDVLPKVESIHRWLPRGMFRVLATVVLSAAMARVVIGSGGDDAVRSTMVLMTIPGVLIPALEAFGRSGREWPATLLRRLAGGVTWVALAGVTTGAIVLFA